MVFRLWFWVQQVLASACGKGEASDTDSDTAILPEDSALDTDSDTDTDADSDTDTDTDTDTDSDSGRQRWTNESWVPCGVGGLRSRLPRGDIPAESLTHINYAFINPTLASGCEIYDSWAAMDKNGGNHNLMQTLKVSRPHLKVLMSLEAGHCPASFRTSH